ncbi:MAG: NUDIX hydrolase [Gammaproteobacteria bacterium]
MTDPIDRRLTYPTELPTARTARETLRPAAVLFALTAHEGVVETVLTVRNSALKSHPGQISFPGGRIEPGDRDVAETAMREAAEEIGIEVRDIEVIGALDQCITGTGYSVVPVVALIPPNYPYRLDHREVAEVFHVPMPHLFDATRHQRLSRIINGARREYDAIDYNGYHIWGATARMIVGLYERLARVRDSASYKVFFGNCGKT